MFWSICDTPLVCFNQKKAKKYILYTLLLRILNTGEVIREILTPYA